MKILKPKPYLKWLEDNEDKLQTKLDESGAEQELHTSLDQLAEELYEIYLRSIEDV